MTTRDLLFRTSRTIARLLTPEDAPIGQYLLERCTSFFELVGGGPPGPAAFQDLYSQFPDGSRPENNVLVGIFNHNGAELVGIAGWARNYPSADTWFLDLMLIAPEHRGKGLGTEAYYASEQWAISGGAKSVELTVAEQNADAYRFWLRVGFVEAGRHGPIRFMSKDNVLITLRKKI